MARWLGLAMAALAMFAAPAEAATPWRVATSEHFVIYSQESAASLRGFAEKLELFDSALRYLFPVKVSEAVPRERLTIYALNSAAAVQQVMGRGSANVDGVYHPSITGSLALTARGEAGLNTQIVLLHEYTHHFMLQNFPAAYPTWFVEGFAEFTSTARFDKEGGVGIGAPANHRAYGLLAGPDLDLARLLGDDLGHLTPAQRDVLYGRGWLLTHMLMFGKGRDGQLNRYIRAINEGTPPRKAAEQAFGDLRQLDHDLDRYLGQSRMTYLLIKAAALKPSPVAVAEVSAAESAAIPIRMQSKYGVDRAEALRLVPLARRAAATYPAEPATQCMLAEAEDDAHNFAEADGAAERLLAADPKSYCGLLFKGQVAMHRAALRKAPADDREWVTARSWLARANHVETERPLPMYLYYQTFRLAKAKPSANAIDALLGAAFRAPQDENARVLAATELLRRHEEADARAMLGPVANGAHSSAGTFLGEIYRRIGSDPSEQLADRLAAGPPEQGATPAASTGG